MRQLNSDELLEKFQSYSLDFKFSEIQNVDVKLTQFFNFLYEQEISKRILERISEDFHELKEMIYIEKFNRTYKYYGEILNSITNREFQGAFGYFIIDEKFKLEKKHSNLYVEAAREWYRNGGDYLSYLRDFNSYFFEPFFELFEWYLYESKTILNNDYFSNEAQENISQKLKEIEIALQKLGFGQQIIFDEFKDVKKLTKKLNKKNWNETIRGKFIDLALSNVVTFEMANKIIDVLTSDGIKFLN